MQRLIALTSLTVFLAACAGDMGPVDDNEGEKVNTAEQSAKVVTIANEAILETRPLATSHLVTKLNLVLANNSILSHVVGSQENRVLSPLAGSTPDKTCPYINQSKGDNTITCRYLVDRALDKAVDDSDDIRVGIEQNVDNKHAGTLKTAEVKYVKGWIGEAVNSGMDVGVIATLMELRGAKVCDQAPSEQQSAYMLGEKQGRALVEQAETEVLPQTPRTICNTDTIAASIRARALTKVENFINQNAICAGFTPDDLEQKVDMAQAEKNRRTGIEEGIRQGHEALRVRLVTSWVCIQPEPQGGGGGGNGGGNGDPLVVDLDGDGIKLAKTRVPFDLSATGNTILMPALRGADALLVIDRDGDGEVSDGAELFGNTTRCGAHACADGIAALAQHDDNKDGRIDAKDKVWTKLRLWNDRDRDGKSSSDELSTPAAFRISAITLAAKLTPWSDGKGNSVLRSIGFERTDGSKGRVHDVWFSVTWKTAPSDPRATGTISTLFDKR